MNFNKNSKVAVVGYGSWATALAKLLIENGVCASWWVGNGEVRESLRREGRNSKYLSDLRFDLGGVFVSDNVDEVVSRAEVVLLASPSAYLDKVLGGLQAGALQKKFVVSAIKGLVEPHSLLTVLKYLETRHGLRPAQLGVVTGPSHAEEVSQGKLSYLTAICCDSEDAKTLGEKFVRPYIRLSCSSDLYGAEYATILKNIYAIAVGMAVGLGYGDNFRAVLISNSALEMTRFLHRSFPDTHRETCASAYLGDLLVTCYSEYSRNRRLGQLVGRGHSVRDALSEMTQVAEGYSAAGCVGEICKHYGIRMPIAEMVHRVLYDDADVVREMEHLTTQLI